MKKPSPCKENGCSGAMCKYWKPTDKWPYFDCSYFEAEFTKGEDEENEKTQDN